MELLAHISEDQTRTQTVAEHLRNTAALAGTFAAAFDAEGEAQFAGILHDIGKYSTKFQQRLKGGAPVDHSTAGAQQALRQGHPQAAFAIAGHHSGLPDGGSAADDPGDSTLFGRRLGIYSVSCYNDQFQKLDAAGALEPLPDGSAILLDPTRYYNDRTGLALDVETGIGLFF